MNTDWTQTKRASIVEWKSERKRKRERCVLKLGNKRYLEVRADEMKLIEMTVEIELVWNQEAKKRK